MVSLSLAYELFLIAIKVALESLTLPLVPSPSCAKLICVFWWTGIPRKFGRTSSLSRPPLDTPGDLQIARQSLSPAETGEVPIKGDGKDPFLGRPVLSSDDTGTQVDPRSSANLGVGGLSEGEHVVAEGPVDENAEMTHVARRGWVETCERSLRCVCI